MAEITHQRHALQRGDILRALKEDYRASMTSVRALGSTLDMLGEAIAPDTLEFQLIYLKDQGYIQTWRTRDMDGFRSDRRGDGHPDAIRFAKLSPKGLQLLDGRIPEDPMVTF